MIITESGLLIFSPAFIRIGLPLQYAQMLIKMALELQPWQLYSKQDEERKAEKLKHVSQMSGYSSRVSEQSSQWMTASFLSWVIWGTSDSWSLAPQNMVFQFSSVQSLSRVWLFATPWITALQASLSIANSLNLSRLTSIASVLPSNHLILSSPSPPAFNLFQHEGLFQSVSSSHQVDKILEFQLQHQSFQWIFRTDFL